MPRRLFVDMEHNPEPTAPLEGQTDSSTDTKPVEVKLYREKTETIAEAAAAAADDAL